MCETKEVAERLLSTYPEHEQKNYHIRKYRPPEEKEPIFPAWRTQLDRPDQWFGATDWSKEVAKLREKEGNVEINVCSTFSDTESHRRQEVAKLREKEDARNLLESD